jgi:hypothetical protein
MPLHSQNLSRLNEAELNNESVKFAGKYVEQRFQNGRDVEKHLVLNCVAHGFYMGARHCETVTFRPQISLKRLLGVGNIDEPEEVWNESIKASNYYIAKKKYSKLSMGDLALVRATVSYGFREGCQWRQKCFGLK